MSSVLQNWGEILRTQNLSDGRHMDAVSRWLLIVRASVFPMTLLSGLIGGLLALSGPHAAQVHWGYLALALLGILVAHAANNMINDYFDLEGGVDSDDYVRGQYAPHPILSGLVSKRGLVAAIAVANVVDLALLIVLTAARGPLTVVFALLGLFISVFYVAPPLRLKHRGLGEPGVAIVWGPLMIGGTYFVATGHIEAWVLLASLPYALLVAAVLMGKHIDKLEADSAKGIHTLPVLLGPARARLATQGLMVLFFVLIALLVATGVLGVWTLLAFLGARHAWRSIRVIGEPPPDGPPPGYPLWPLWYVAWAFRLTRFAGGMFVLGLALNAIWPIHL